MVNGLLLVRGWNKLKNIINIEEIDIKLCTTRDVKDIFNLQNIVIENFKENEKGYFLPFKESSFPFKAYTILLYLIYSWLDKSKSECNSV